MGVGGRREKWGREEIGDRKGAIERVLEGEELRVDKMRAKK